jgi:homospermidine synthase
MNLSVDVDSVPLIAHCREIGALYVDTALERWPGVPSARAQDRTNFARRAQALALGRAPGAPTAVITHGANPGLVSHFVKEALLRAARHLGATTSAENMSAPDGREAWAAIAQALDVRTVHIAERDTQWSPRRRRPGEFVNTWSVPGFLEEACQPAELGWGTHERHFPPDAHRHDDPAAAAIWLARPGAGTRVRSWTPATGPMEAFLVTHAESVSIAQALTVGDPAAPDYRPTVHYAYHPCDDAVLSLHELAGAQWRWPPHRRLLRDDIEGGMDELGVLLMGPRVGACWHGSQLSIAEARGVAPFNSATSLQVAAGAMAAAVWAVQHPDRGLLEPDDLPHAAILDIARPYLGRMTTVFSDWTPLAGRGRLFDEALDARDPWQFLNFRVT